MSLSEASVESGEKVNLYRCERSLFTFKKFINKSSMGTDLLGWLSSTLVANLLPIIRNLMKVTKVNIF